MKKKLFTIALLYFTLLANILNAQNIKRTIQPKATNQLEAKTNNFSAFTISYNKPSTKWLANNKAYSNHPDAGFLPKDNPCPSAIEIIGKRTSNSKYFIDNDSA